MELNPATPGNRAFLHIFIHDTGSGMWYNIDSTNTMLVCRRKGGQNVTDRQDYRFILQIEPGRYASRGKREHTEPKTDFTKVC